MEPEGMVNGSTIKERITSTMNNTEISELEVSTVLPIMPLRWRSLSALSASQMITVTNSARVSHIPTSISI